MSNLKDKFLNVFTKSDSIEVNGRLFHSYENTIHSTSRNPANSVILLNLNERGKKAEVIISENDLKQISYREDFSMWSAGGYNIRFFNLSPQLV